MQRIEREDRYGRAPKHILADFRQDHPDRQFSARDMYNARAVAKRRKLGPRTPLQALMEELTGNSSQWYCKYTMDAWDQLTNLFFSYNPSLDWLAKYPDILFIDCTYKTNRFNLPLCIATSTTACNKTFYVAFAFLRHEDQPSYNWFVEQLKEVFNTCESRGPEVIFTDKEDALINSLENNFPESHHLLCTWHINKNLTARIKTGGYFNNKEDLKRWLDVWYALVYAQTEDQYNDCVTQLRLTDPGTTAKYPNKSLFEYIKAEYLDGGNKEKHVRCWTKRLTTFGKTTTQTAESGHWGIKRDLESSNGDIPAVVKAVQQKLDNHLQDLLLLHERQKGGFWSGKYNIPIFRYLRHDIGSTALGHVLKQWNERTKEPTCLMPCTLKFRITLGLPCKHELENLLFSKEPLRRHHFHPHWWLDPHQEPSNPAPEARIQDPVLVRRRGRPNNPRRELSQWEVLLQHHARYEEGKREREEQYQQHQSLDREEALANNQDTDNRPDILVLSDLTGVPNNTAKRGKSTRGRVTQRVNRRQGGGRGNKQGNRQGGPEGGPEGGPQDGSQGGSQSGRRGQQQNQGQVQKPNPEPRNTRSRRRVHEMMLFED